MPSPLTPPMLGYGGDGNLLPLSVPSSHLGKQAHPMMYARTTSWISRKVSPTFLFRTSTMRGVSYSKRNVDSLSMHRCPTAMPGLCCWPQCLPPPRGLGCARRHSSVCRGIKIKINRMIRIKKKCYWWCSVLSRAVRLPPLHRDGFSSSYKYRAGCSCALHGAGVGRVLELFLGPGGARGQRGSEAVQSLVPMVPGVDMGCGSPTLVPNLYPTPCPKGHL